MHPFACHQWTSAEEKMDETGSILVGLGCGSASFGACAGSPASLPSIAETSIASSSSHNDDDEYDYSDLARALYINEDTNGSFSVQVVENTNNKATKDDYSTTTATTITEDRDQQEPCGGAGSEISITSSESTVVAAWNLSTPKMLRRDENCDAYHHYHPYGQFYPAITFEEPRIGTSSILRSNTLKNSSSSSDADEKENSHVFESRRHRNSQSRKKLYQLEEEPQLSTSSCVSLTPRQLADIFHACNSSRNIWPSKNALHETELSISEQDDASSNESTTSYRTVQEVSYPNAQFLERECKALKKIIQEDATKIVSLKRAMEAQRSLNALKEMEIEDKQIELLIALQRIDALKKDAELFQEREIEFVGTIEILKQELDNLSRYKLLNEACLRDDVDEVGSLLLQEDDKEDLKAEMELFASQVVEQEALIAELRSTLEVKDQMCQELQAQIKSLQERLDEVQKMAVSEDADKNGDGNNNNNDDNVGVNEESSVVEGPTLETISQRLESIEKEKTQAENMFLEAMKQKDQELHEIRLWLQLEKSYLDGIMIKISQDPEEVEAIVARDIETQEPLETTTGSDCCCGPSSCDAWIAISKNSE